MILILFFLSQSYLFLKVTSWSQRRFRACSLIIRLSTIPKPVPLSLSSGRNVFCYFLVRSSNLDISVSAKSWKVLFRHVCRSGWLELVFSLAKCMAGSGCSTGKSPKWFFFYTFAMFKRDNSNKEWKLEMK